MVSRATLTVKQALYCGQGHRNSVRECVPLTAPAEFFTLNSMNIEVRNATAAELADIERLVTYAFADSGGEPIENWLQPEWSLCAFDGETLVASSGSVPFAMRCNGREIAADGVTLVSVDPGYRRQGIVRQLMEGLLRRAREAEIPVSILWASMGAIYQRFGYGLVGHPARYEIEPRYVQFQDGVAPTGRTRLLARDAALEVLPDVYRRYAEPRNGLLHRTYHWKFVLPERKKGDREHYAAVHYGDDGTAEAYVVYQTEYGSDLEPQMKQTLTIGDLAWTSLNGYRAIWSYLAAHDLVGKIVWRSVPADDPARWMFLEPRMLYRGTNDGVWLRVVDTAGTLAARGYGVDDEVVVAVQDDVLCPWNNGAYRVTADDGTADVQSVSAQADVVFTPNGLASAVMGAGSVSQLVRAGRASAAEADLGRLDALFATRYAPHCADMF